MVSTQIKWLAVAAVALVQTLALLWMVYDRVSLINSGREVTLEVIPVDPRSLFRGDYVILSYKVSTAEDVPMPETLTRNEKVFVRLKNDVLGGWQIASLSRTPETSANDDEIILQARIASIIGRGRDKGRQIRLNYGIESYFVPERSGKALEKKVRDGKISAIVAVDNDGRAAIKGLDVAGTRLLDPPLF